MRVREHQDMKPGPKGACLRVRTWNPNPASWGLQVLVVVSGTERMGFSKQDARGNLVVKTPISVSGHETRSTAIPKLDKTRISVSGHETQSNRWIFPFLFLKKYQELCLISWTILIWFLYFREILDRGFLFLHSTLLLYSLSPYWQTEWRTDLTGSSRYTKEYI